MPGTSTPTAKNPTPITVDCSGSHENLISCVMVWMLLDEPFGFTPNDEREDEIQTAQAPQQGQSGALQDGRQEAAFEAVCGMDLSGEQEILRRQGAQMSPASPLHYRRLIARVTRSHLAIG